MADKLLVRAYNVGCGDCIYVRIPGPNDGFHMLIDCGKKGGAELLKKSIEHLETQLPKGSAAGKKRLDLLVATHRHEDHIKGFDPEWFANIEVKHTWLSVAMNPDHPQAKGVKSLHELARKGMNALLDSGRVLSPEIEMLGSLYVSNNEADKFLDKLNPEFVHAGMKNADRKLGLPAGARLHVLGPEEDVDGYYLGEEADATLRGFQSITGTLGATAEANITPRNISEADFELLQSRMLSNSLAFAAKDSSIQNNLSVVLLLEWKKRRLLFVGDAEWEGEFNDKKHNGSWNVMWKLHGKTHLNKPVDFLKIGHHGSINATPHPPSMRPKSKKSVDGGIYAVLDTILPQPKNGKPTAQAVVSTEREFYNPIPEGALLVDLAQRVSNTRNYQQEFKRKRKNIKGVWNSDKAKRNQFFEKYEAPFLDQPQPLRTDLEAALNDSAFVDVEIAAGR